LAVTFVALTLLVLIISVLLPPEIRKKVLQELKRKWVI